VFPILSPAEKTTRVLEHAEHVGSISPPAAGPAQAQQELPAGRVAVRADLKGLGEERASPGASVPTARATDRAAR
jgi:hypothetical protein